MTPTQSIKNEVQQLLDSMLMVRHTVKRMETTHVTAYWLNPELLRIDVKLPQDPQA